MKDRCDNPESKDAGRYHDRGITYSEEWQSYDKFYDDMASSWQQGLTIDRIDNDMGYSKENCRWTTRKVQNNNTSRNKFFTINGVTKTMAQWCDEVKVKSSTVRQRYYCYGWSIEKALNFHKKEGY